VSLRSKLSRLDSAGAAPAPRAAVLDDLRARIQATLERTARRAPAPLPPVDTVDLPFATEPTDLGPLHVRMQRLSPAHRTGRAPLACARDASAELLALLALDPALAACRPEGALFLDTETTGLAGGTGTVAFLVGLAWWDGGSLVLEQLLVRALGEEAPVLARVSERVERASMLVTFNGKSFDMPLLRTRFVMARIAPPREPPHLDLLHVARRVHAQRAKGSRQACRLVALERDVLGFERSDDVPSGEVSACYLHFLRTGDAGALLGVIEHNAWDVVAMAALVGLYGEPLQGGLACEDLVGVAQTLRRAGALDRASEAAQAAFEQGGSPESLRVRAEIAKARGDRARALADFEALASAVDDAPARLELAKLYEHWVKEPRRALAWVARGTGETPEGEQRRRARLARKAERAAQERLPSVVNPAGDVRCAAAHPVVPRLGRAAGDLDHLDAARDGAHQLAEVAPDALGLVHPRDPIAGDRADGEGDGGRGGTLGVRVRRSRAILAPGEDALVGAVLAGDDAPLAPDARGSVDAGDELVREVEIAPLLVRRDSAPDEIADAAHPALIEPVGQPVDHVADDPVPQVHHRRAHLHRR
jgi:uncharacterized protein YprB with RNaseH-like and TPR domain